VTGHGRDDIGWSRVAQDDAEAEFWPDGRPEPETARRTGYVRVPWGVVLAAAIVGAVVGGIVGWAIGPPPDPNHLHGERRQAVLRV
jgi:hypothetical protein